MFGDPATNPKGWRTYSFADLYSVKPNFGTMVKPTADSSAFLDIRVANIQGDQLDLSDRKYVQLSPKDIERHSVRNGDLLIARAIGSLSHLGKCVVTQPGGAIWAFDSHVMRVRLDPNRLLAEYAHAFLNSGSGRGLFLKNTRSSAVQFNINSKEFGPIAIPVPPKALQRAFVLRVVEIESVITQQERVAAAVDQLVASLTFRLFAEG